jgi:sigma-B regulation protein RsbU (phosphoserine phosphatase)
LAPEFPPLVLLPLDGIPVPPLRVTVPDVTVGRGPECQARIDVPSISRRHARLRHERGSWIVEDLGSRHGTWVDGVRVEPGRDGTLNENSTLTLGPCRFRVAGTNVGSSTMVALAQDEQQVGRGSTVKKVSDEDLGALAKRRLDALLEISEILQESSGETELARCALDALVRGTGYACATWVRLRGPSQLEVLGVAMQSGRGATSELPVSRTLLNAAREGAIAKLEDQPFLREAESVVAGHITSALCVPVVLGREVDSFLYLASGFGANDPQQDAATYAAALARFCALSLANLRRRRLEEQQRMIMHDLEQARLVQQKFVPADRGTIGPMHFAMHTRPGRFVAGDICGVRDLGRNRAIFFVGDVSGKGMGPALLMTSLQSFLDAAAVDTPPDELVSRASTHFARYSTDSRFATLWLACADGEGAQLQCVDAGHGLAFLIRDGVAVQVDEVSGGPPLGVVEGQIYGSSHIRLSPGERLVIVTDGVTEQADGRGEQFGTDRLVAALRGSANCDDDVARVTSELQRYAGTTEFSDDMTVLSMTLR